MKSHQLEIKTVFLNEALEEDVYVEQPDGYQEGGPSIGCHLHLALHGLKQALRAWHIQLSEMGFRPLDADANLLYRDDNSGRTWLLVCGRHPHRRSHQGGGPWTAVRHR